MCGGRRLPTQPRPYMSRRKRNGKTMENYSIPNRRRRFKFSQPLAILITTTGTTLMALLAAFCWTSYYSHRRCADRQALLANAELKYWLKYHRPLAGDEQALQALVTNRILSEPAHCPQGGKYSARDNGDGSVTIRCSLPEHQIWFSLSEKGLRSRFQPAASRQE